MEKPDSFARNRFPLTQVVLSVTSAYPSDTNRSNGIAKSRAAVQRSHSSWVSNSGSSRSSGYSTSMRASSSTSTVR
jgi:hypothetical protein